MNSRISSNIFITPREHFVRVRAARRNERSPSKLAAIWVLLALLFPTLPAAHASVDATAPLAVVPSDAWRELLELAREDPRANLSGLPETANDILHELAPTAGTPPSLGLAGWQAYLAAIQADATSRERAAIASFETRRPAEAAAIGDLAGTVALALQLRNTAFANLTPVERSVLPSALTKVATGDAEALSAPESAALAAIDLAPMIEAASLLTDAAARARTELPEAASRDAAFAQAVPDRLLEPGATPTDVLDAVAGDAAPVQVGITGEEAILAAQALSGVQRGLTPLLPPGLDGAVANIIAARARATDAQGTASLAATLRAELPRIERAAFNLSFSPPYADATRSTRAPFAKLQRDGLEQATVALREMTGTAADPPEGTFVEGLAALHQALGLPLNTSSLAAARAASGSLGPELSARIGSVLLAQARYQSDLSPSSPLPTRVRASMPEALAISARDGPLSMSDVDLLREGSSALFDTRAATGADGGAILSSALLLLRAPDARSAELSSFEYDDGVVVITGTGSDVHEHGEHSHAPAFLLDLGGNDTYRIPLASIPTPPAVAVNDALPASMTSLAIDLSGDDTYQPPHERALGAAVGTPFSPTFALLLDGGGNDLYEAGNESLGWGVDGVGIALDAWGNDSYHSSAEAFAGANSTMRPTTAAVGIFVDGQGNDVYSAQWGFANVTYVHRPMVDQRVDAVGMRIQQDQPAEAAATAGAMFLDLGGNDTYHASCPRDASPCFGTPRDGNATVIFVDDGGQDSWPRPTIDPGHQTMGESGFLFVADDPQARESGGSLPSDLIPATDPEHPLAALVDSDRDGFPDAVETLLLSDPNDPRDYPVGIPRLPSEVPSLDGLVPGAESLEDANMLVNLPGLIAIGGPGPTVYRHRYNVTIDLGLADDDVYTSDVAVDGIAIDLGGNDLYAPLASHDEPMPSVAVARTRDAFLLDLAGNDHYVVPATGEASSQISGIALLLDATGDDIYESPGNHSQASAAGTGSMAWLVDLAGNDTYRAPTQGFASGSGAFALFLDQQGGDTYEQTAPTGNVSAADEDQGAIEGANSGVGPMAAFIDQSGHDTYRFLDRSSGSLVDISSIKNDHMRFRPVDDHDLRGVMLFVDVDATSDQDHDGANGAAEALAGTSASDPTEVAYDAGGLSGYYLDLPRLGLAVGSPSRTTYARDFALVVDLGGADRYLAHAGASTPLWPVSLVLDAGPSDDTYETNRTVKLTSFEGVTSLPKDPSGQTLYVDGTYVSAQGAGLLGVGVLYDDGGRNVMNASLDLTCGGTCPGSLNGVVASQGAGVAGVGVLVLGAGGGALTASGNVSGPQSRIRTASQGAGVLGIGILASQDASNAATYTLRATSQGAASTNATSGQGYAMRGVGVLLDAGGSDHFDAQTLAQGAADDDDHGGPLAPDPALGVTLPESHARASVGALLLTGVGDDTLTAWSRAQAYAGTGGLALLVDNDGSDIRLLKPPAASGTTSAAYGQAAATYGGTALLIDDRGNDQNIALGSRAQAYSEGGTAILADLGGGDRYQASDMAQGMAAVWPRPHASLAWTSPGFAALFDRQGNDAYMLTGVSPRGQGAATRDGAAVPTALVAGVGLFVDSGGFDSYASNPLGHQAFGAPATPPDDGNGWMWSADGSAATDRQWRLTGVGIDNDDVMMAFTRVQAVISPVGGAHLRVAMPTSAGPTLSGPVTMSGWLGTAAGPVPQEIDQTVVDRTEFYFDHTLLAEGVSVSDGSRTAWIDTGRVGPDGLPEFPDGLHQFETWVYPMTGVRGAQVDAEPFIASGTFALDNPPVAHDARLASIVSSQRPLHLPIRVDRDLDAFVRTGEPTCVVCDQPTFPQVSPDEWALIPSNDPYGAVAGADPCTGDGCLPTLDVSSGRGTAYLTWSPPTRDASLVAGYRVSRVNASGNETLVGFVDARAPLRFIDQPDPNDLEGYKLDVLRTRPQEGKVVLLNESSMTFAAISAGPGPATGLAAAGAEGGIRLTWRAAADATAYDIFRARRGHPYELVATATGSSFVDTNVTSDIEYDYQITPVNELGQGPSSLIASGTASPGHDVTVRLDGDGGDFEVLPHTHLGGSWTHDIVMDAGSSHIPDGTYRLIVDYVDGAGRENATVANVTLDSTPPTTSITLPAAIGLRFVDSGGLHVPFTATDETSGAVHTLVGMRVDGRTWRTFGPFNATAGVATLPAPTHGANIELAAVSVDAAGNVNGVTHPRSWAPSLTDALADAELSDDVSRYFVDLVPPSGDAVPVEAVVAPGTTLHFFAHIFEDTQLVDARLAVGTDEVPLALLPNGSYGASWQANGAGRYQINAFATDAAGNIGRIPFGVVLVDGTPPVATLASVIFPGGRTQGHLGETASILVNATDDATPADELNVTADLNNVSSRGITRLEWTGAGTEYRARDFLVDRLPMHGEANATIRLTDAAGNVRSLQVQVITNGTSPAMGEPEVTPQGARSISVTWDTPEPTTAEVDFGASPQLGRSLRSDAPATHHAFTITGLAPDTDHFLRAVSISRSGVQTTSAILTAHTGYPLTLGVSQRGGLPVSRGTVQFLASVEREDGASVDGSIDVILTGPRGSPRSLPSVTIAGDKTPVDLSLADRDGNYTLTLRPHAGTMSGASVTVPFLIDRTPPIVSLDSAPVVAPGQIMRVRAMERGSGLDVANLSWTFDGLPCSAQVSGDVVMCRVPDSVGQVTHISVNVPDRAGNVAALAFDLDVDRAGPGIVSTSVEGPHGEPRVRPGGDAVVRVRTNDHAALSMTVDLSALDGPSAVRATPDGDMTYEATAKIAGTAVEGSYTIHVTSRDAVGAVALSDVMIAVDATPPTITSAKVIAVTPTSVLVAVVTDEPTIVEVRTSVGTPIELGGSGYSRYHDLKLSGLSSSAFVNALVIATDQAGWQTLTSVNGTARHDNVPPGGVSGLNATDLGDGSLRISWSPATDDQGVAAYIVQRATDNGVVTNTTIDETELLDSIAVGQRATYSVTAVDYGGNRGSTTSIEATSVAIPHLENGSVQPPLGGPGWYDFRVDLHDLANEAPDVTVFVDDASHSMTSVGDCRVKCTLSAEVWLLPQTLGDQGHRYHFRVTGARSANLPLEGEFSGPLVYGSGPAVAGLSAAGRVHLPDVGIVLAIGTVALAGLLLHWRRVRR